MLTVKQFLYSEDNLGYVVHGSKKALVIDGGASSGILDYLAKQSLELQYITNSHSHHDHTCGNNILLKQTRALLLDYNQLIKPGKIIIEDEEIKILDTPGHSLDSVCFYFNGILVTGDTLFIARIGKCFSGEMELYFNSINNLLALPGSTLIYPGHDYTDYSLQKARELEPNNRSIDEFLVSYNPQCIASTIAWEKRINPFFRFNEPQLQAALEAKGFKSKTSFDRFKALRDNF